MTNPNDPRNDYAHQGQQDDYFDQDLAIAGHELKAPMFQEHTELEEYTPQGQQDDHFDEDLANSDRAQQQ